MKTWIKVILYSIFIVFLFALGNSVMWGGKWFGVEYYLRWLFVSPIIIGGSLIGYFFLKRKGIVE